MSFGVRNYIDSRVNVKLKDPVFLAEIAAFVSPSVIFNSKESILVDQGAGKYISSISVVCDETPDNIPTKITVSLNQHFAYEPILTPIQSEFMINAERGKGNEWVFELTQFDSYREENDAYKFRMELIQGA